MLLACLLSPPAARAQFSLVVVDSAGERPSAQSYDLGSFYNGESASAHFRAVNTSGAPATLRAATVAGAGFTLTGPALPVGLAAQAGVDLYVVFRAAEIGAYSAALRGDGFSTLLTAVIAPRLTYRADPPGAAAFPGPLDFGAVVRGTVAQRRITILNETQLVLIVPAILLQAEDFALTSGTPSGRALEPRQGAEFTLAFSPHLLGARQASFTLGDRTYPLTGTGIDPPLPKPTVTLDLKSPASAQQGVMMVRFDAPAAIAGSGLATLDFAGAPDPAIAFAAGGRSVAFPIAPGDLQAVLPFQTGTTAGILTFTAQVGDRSDRQSLTITAAPPAISSVQALRTAAGLEVRVTGFDNTRTLGALSFTFLDSAGNGIGTGAIRTDATADFARYFAGSDLGGVFSLRAQFPVTGDASKVAWCEVGLGNSAGSTKTARTAF